MPVSSEVLNEDIKELRGDVQKLAVGLAELRQEVRDAIGIGKWAGTALAAALLTSGVGAVIWGARLDAKVSGMESRMNEKFQEVGARFDKLESKMDARFDKLEAAIGRLAEQARAGREPAAAK